MPSRLLHASTLQRLLAPLMRLPARFVTRGLHSVGRTIVRYLERPARGYEPFFPSDIERLRRLLRPGDVLLVEGNSHLAGVIKYLTHSTWSHAALCVGPIVGMATPHGEPHVLVESNIGEGVISAPLSRYARVHTRICRPIGLSTEDLEEVCNYAIKRIGLNYDLRNFIDLGRYLIPLPVPQRWRRRMVALGSGSPTKFICSALIASAFQSVRYPILPKITDLGSRAARREILAIRQSTLYMPRDFDISPYFAVIKPTIEFGFDYKALHWVDLPILSVPEVHARKGSFDEGGKHASHFTSKDS
jgi:hypothetical protein